MSGSAPVEFYEQVAATSADEAASAERLAERVSWARLLLAAVVVLALVAGDRWPGPAWSPWLALGGTLLFVAAVHVHGRLSERARSARRREAAAAAGIARVQRRWDAMTPWRPLDVPGGWPTVLATDLGVTGSGGERSLMRLLDVVHPAMGGRRLLRWLLGDPAPVSEIAERQVSAVALRGAPELLLACAAEARHGTTPASSRGIEAFRSWSTRRDVAPSSLVAPVMSVLTLAGVIAAFAVGGASAGARVVVPAIIVQLALSTYARRRLERDLPGVDTALSQIAGATVILSLVTGAGDVPGALGGIQRRLRETGSVASLRALARLLAWNEVRYSPMGHWLLNMTVGLDVHLARAVARWRELHGEAAASWLEDGADAEALIALGTLAFENPQWCAPRVQDDGSAAPLDAHDVVHPLLDPAVAVPNDATLAAAGDAILISGSNMAGKTTFLRATGLAILLAQAGSVTPARQLSLRRCRLRSSVRVEDDLSHGVSLFLAEVTRLRDVIRDAQVREAPPVFFLFDEILHGTNAADRRLATRAVMEQLRLTGGTGLVTTHDPEIGAARQLHFDGDVERHADGSLRLVFDYRAKPGPAQRTNALFVLEMMGIDAGAAGPRTRA